MAKLQREYEKINAKKGSHTTTATAPTSSSKPPFNAVSGEAAVHPLIAMQQDRKTEAKRANPSKPETTKTEATKTETTENVCVKAAIDLDSDEDSDEDIEITPKVDTKQTEPRMAKGTQEEKSAAAHTYDQGYSKWDSFDVDQALTLALTLSMTITINIKMNLIGPGS